MDATGLVQVGARYYDPTLGRFVSVDPVMDLADPQQWHGYAYANNNPVTFTDPTGLYANPWDTAGYRPVVGAKQLWHTPGYTPVIPGSSQTRTPGGTPPVRLRTPRWYDSFHPAVKIALFQPIVVGDLLYAHARWRTTGHVEVQGHAEQVRESHGEAAAVLSVLGDSAPKPPPLQIVGVGSAYSYGSIDGYDAAVDIGGISLVTSATIAAGAAGAGAPSAGVRTSGLTPYAGNTGTSTWGGVKAWFGREYKLGPNSRIAPFGNRTGHPTGRFPHYHRRVVDGTGETLPGQGIGRHRPWDSKSTDTSFWDRF